MLKELYSVFSLQYFLVSNERKLWLVGTLLLLGSALYGYTQISSEHYLAREATLLLIVFLSSSVAVSLLRFFIVTAYRQRVRIPLGSHDNFILGMDATARTVVLFITAGSIFPIFGIPFSTFLTSLSLIAVALVILFKDYLLNFFDGYRLLFSNDFLIGDYIKTKNTPKGKIMDVTYRATKIRTDEGDVVFIPNATLMGDETTNFSKQHKRLHVPFSIDLKKLTTIDELETFITERLQPVLQQLQKKDKIIFHITKVSNDTIECTVEIPVDKYSFANEAMLKTTVYKAVFDYAKSSQAQTESLFAQKG